MGCHFLNPFYSTGPLFLQWVFLCTFTVATNLLRRIDSYPAISIAG